MAKGMVLDDFLSVEQMSKIKKRLRNGERLGQAFMNTLDAVDYVRLTGSLYDPFYYDTPARVFAAIEYLTAP